MRSTKKQQPAKSKRAEMRMKDLRPTKDAKAGAQKKEANILAPVGSAGV